MAQPMMHLLVADKVYTEKSAFIHSYGDFLLGSIAPDAVHTKKDYVREMKDNSHYRLNSESPASFFDTFFDTYCASEHRDFALGYLIHLLSDVIWYFSVRAPFKESFGKAPAPDMTLNEAYYADCEQIEHLMFGDQDAARIIEAVKNGKAYSLEGLIDAEAVTAWKEKLLFDHINKRQLSSETAYITEQQIRNYIADCAQKCTEYLGHLPTFQNLQ